MCISDFVAPQAMRVVGLSSGRRSCGGISGDTCGQVLGLPEDDVAVMFFAIGLFGRSYVE